MFCCIQTNDLDFSRVDVLEDCCRKWKRSGATERILSPKLFERRWRHITSVLPVVPFRSVICSCLKLSKNK